MTDRLPNFLLAGAAKRGTPSIATSMAQHPDIHISSIKNPSSFRPRRSRRFNLSGWARVRWAQRPFNPTGFKGKAYRRLAVNGFDVDKLMRWVEPIRSANIEPISMNPRTRQCLHDAYKADMKKLSNLLQTDLTHWFSSDNTATGTG